MTDTKKSAELAPGADLSMINPLIDIDGDTTCIRGVLGVLSFVFLEVNSDLSLSSTDCLGIGAILDTCKKALEHMDPAEVAK